MKTSLIASVLFIASAPFAYAQQTQELAPIDASIMTQEVTVQQLANEHSLPITHGPDRWLEERLLARNAGVLPVLILLDGHATQEPSP